MNAPSLLYSCCIAVFAFSLSTVAQRVALPAPAGVEWPRQDVPPPINTTWTGLWDLNNGTDFKIPVRAPGSADGGCPMPDVHCVYPCFGCLRPTDIHTCDKGIWGLTFDDGPSPATDTLLTTLAQTSTHATFFIVGSRAIAYPDTLNRTFQAGHTLGIHTWSHTLLTSQTNEQIVAEIMWTAWAIYLVTGTVPLYVRPPFGDVDDRARAVIERMGFK
ncbi:chitin deacetylase, partial [Borealophlyctis nickersoniae]